MIKLQILPKVSLTALIAGFVIIINSAGWGSYAASTYLGGSVTSPEAWAILIQGYTNSFIIIGGVLFFLGGLGCLISILFLEMQKQ